jgi:O-antigen/teichoic acid export membrane protein
MARLQRYLHSVASGYVLIAANAFYTLASVPLALAYLSKEQYGIWALVVQISQFISFIEFGMTPAITRILVDFKDRVATKEYGSMVVTSWLIFTIQSVLILLAGAAVASVPGLFRIPAELVPLYRQVVFLQFCIHACSFMTRLFGTLLESHQRQYVSNYTTLASLAVSYLVLFASFRAGAGLYSLIAGGFAGWIVAALLSGILSWRMRVLPRAGCWAGPSRRTFKELFHLGRGILLVTVGSQLIMSIQPLIISRTLGLEATAVWSVCTRPFFLVGLVLWRFFDYSLPAFAEMVVRGEAGRLAHRFRSLVVINAGLSAVAAVLLAVCNGPFVRLWTHGAMSWPVANDVLLALWLFGLSIFHCHGMFILTSKRLRAMPYVYLLDGFALLTAAGLLSGRYGLGSILAVSIISNICIHGQYSLFRTARYFGLRFRDVAWEWLRPSFAILSVMAAAAAVFHLGFGAASPVAYLSLSAGLLGGLGFVLFLVWGLRNIPKEDLAGTYLGRFARSANS